MNFNRKISNASNRSTVSVFVPGDDLDILLLSMRSGGLTSDLYLSMAQAEELSTVLREAIQFAVSSAAVDAVNRMSAEELQLLPTAANEVPHDSAAI